MTENPLFVIKRAEDAQERLRAELEHRRLACIAALNDLTQSAGPPVPASVALALVTGIRPVAFPPPLPIAAARSL